tara:strand:- start:38919 stop:39446 length:528 start_codon:yes stop_codon:yes gene_type:complete
MMGNANLTKSVDKAEAVLNRAVYEDFLYLEAQLLDEWKLDEWFALFAEDATYDVPTAGASDDVSSSEKLFYISDDYFRLGHRVRRLNQKAAHSEWPRSHTSRLISNTRILGSDDSGVHLRSAFVTHRSKGKTTDMFCGHHLHTVKMVDGELKIVAKRSMLDLANLRPQGRVSIIL